MSSEQSRLNEEKNPEEEKGPGIETAVPEEDATGEEESFAALFEKESPLPGRLEPGQRLKVRVISVSGDMVFVDLGGKSEGVIDTSEFRNEDGTLSVGEGDTVDAFFVSVQNGIRKLTTKVRGYSTVNLAGIRDAYDAGLPVLGKVKGELKGGYEVLVSGIRCFCPYSQIDLRGGRDSSIYVGENFPFKVLEYEENGRNVILSRRVLLEEERQAELEKFKQTLEVGMELTGKVRSILKFGVFVDLGNIDGLIPLSELGWGRTEKPEDLLSPGQEVTVKVIGIDWEKERLTLSLKAMQPNPWENVASKYPVESQVRGVIVRLAPFGAFVNLEPGVDGLIHISALGAGRRVAHPKEVVEVGQWVEAYVVAVDAAGKKLSLSLQPKVEQEPVVLPEVGDILGGTVERVMPYGIFVKLESGVTGLLPNAEMGTPRGSNHNRMFPPDTKMQVIVIGVDPETGKVSLSRSQVSTKVEREEFNRYRDSVETDQKSSASLGSFGELLKAKLQKNPEIVQDKPRPVRRKRTEKV